MKPYHYALLRYVHHAACGEFVNIGIVMWTPLDRQIRYHVTEKYGRLSRFFSDFDGAGYRHLVRDLAVRLREAADQEQRTLDDVLAGLLPKDSGCFQCSRPMGGLADDPTERAAQLYYEFVGRFEGATPRERRDEAEILTRIEQGLRQRDLQDRVQWNVDIQGENYAHKFRFGWTNHMPQVMEPISFDYLAAPEIVEKANAWTGRLLHLNAGRNFKMTGIVSAPQRSDLLPAFDQAVTLLRTSPGVREIVPEEQLDLFLPQIEKDLAG